MATKPRQKIGMMPCEGQRCESHTMGRMVTVYRSESGTLGYHCDICERSPYAKPGTGQHQEWVDEMLPMPETSRAAAVEFEDKKEAEKPELLKPKKPGFSLGGLM